MRITNSMIRNNTSNNMSTNKGYVDTLNTQMSTQKKIDRPSDDPVIAIRALRLRSSLSEINQYYEKNIPDAESWLEVTETALKNMESILTDVYRQCVNGATDHLKESDRNTILTNLQKLRERYMPREMPIMREEPFLPDIRQINPLHLARIHQTPVIILPRSWNLKILLRRHIIPDCLPFRPQMT